MDIFELDYMYMYMCKGERELVYMKRTLVCDYFKEEVRTGETEGEERRRERERRGWK